MRAITLTQPYATLVACGEKHIETRSWRTPYRGTLAIHAGAGLEPVGGMRGLIDLIESEPFASVLRPHISGYTPEERARDLPRGEIIAVIDLSDCRRIEADGLPAGVPASVFKTFPNERAFGDYRPGRYAWLLERRLRLNDETIPCRGALGVWKLPKEAREALAELEPLWEVRQDTGRS